MGHGELSLEGAEGKVLTRRGIVGHDFCTEAGAWGVSVRGPNLKGGFA